MGFETFKTILNQWRQDCRWRANASAKDSRELDERQEFLDEEHTAMLAFVEALMADAALAAMVRRAAIEGDTLTIKRLDGVFYVLIGGSLFDESRYANSRVSLDEAMAVALKDVSEATP